MVFHPITTNEPEPVNPSGIIPFEFKVLIEPEQSDLEKRAIKSGLVVPDSTKEHEKHAQMKGRIVAMSPLAFTYGDWPEGVRLPKVGDKVLFAKYAGAFVEGRDEVKYKIVNDKDIAAIITF